MRVLKQKTRFLGYITLMGLLIIGVWNVRSLYGEVATHKAEKARLVIHADNPSTHAIPRYMTGKFCEHLYSNVDKGMDAQILLNPTLADYPFANFPNSLGQYSSDGVRLFATDRKRIAEVIRNTGKDWGWPESILDHLVQDRFSGSACWWIHEGERNAIILSPYTGPYGYRAQRIQVQTGGQGIAQWTYLPYAVRLLPFIDLVTHSATVNHGGGLKKQNERVFATPCHYSQSMFAAFADARPVGTKLEISKELSAPRVVPRLGFSNEIKAYSYKIIDAVAAIASDGSLLISIVHRGVEDKVNMDIVLYGFPAETIAYIQALNAEYPWSRNTLETPELIKPVESTLSIVDSKLALMLKPYSYTRVRIGRTD